ncbi:MAG: hypothetical protein M3083_12550 [Actinomycetota bacterium]|nr:hypothetical protein [Actinomycetota bacterium]
MASTPTAHAAGPTGTVTEFSTGISTGSGPVFITAGPDGSLWFTETAGDKLGKITTAGTVTETGGGSAQGGPLAITSGPDGNLWFTSDVTNQVFRATRAGNITGVFTVGNTVSNLWGISSGPDGNLWVTEIAANKVARITPAGVVTEFSAGISANAHPDGITAGPDGNLWFTENGGNRVAKITPAGVVTEYSTGITATSDLRDITAGADGNLWFTEFRGNRVGRITPAGVVTEFSTGITANSGPQGITAGPDGNLWFVETQVSKVGTVALGMAPGTTAAQATSATVVGRTLSISLAQTSVGFGAHMAGTSSGAIPAGSITYTNTLNDGRGWSASVAATDMVAGPNWIGVANLTYSPGLVSAGGGATGPAPAAAARGPFSFSGCNSPGDVVHGTSYSCPKTLMTAGATTQGSWVAAANTVTLNVPPGQVLGAYAGALNTASPADPDL